MIIQTENITYGYSHYTQEPIDDDHKCALIPQSIADGWEALCSCGAWRAFESFYKISSKDALIDALKNEHGKHVSATQAVKSD